MSDADTDTNSALDIIVSLTNVLSGQVEVARLYTELISLKAQKVADNYVYAKLVLDMDKKFSFTVPIRGDDSDRQYLDRTLQFFMDMSAYAKEYREYTIKFFWEVELATDTSVGADLRAFLWSDFFLSDFTDVIVGIRILLNKHYNHTTTGQTQK